MMRDVRNDRSRLVNERREVIVKVNVKTPMLFMRISVIWLRMGVGSERFCLVEGKVMASTSTTVAILIILVPVESMG
jgi:hypothetical protein